MTRGPGHQLTRLHGVWRHRTHHHRWFKVVSAIEGQVYATGYSCDAKGRPVQDEPGWRVVRKVRITPDLCGIKNYLRPPEAPGEVVSEAVKVTVTAYLDPKFLAQSVQYKTPEEYYELLRFHLKEKQIRGAALLDPTEMLLHLTVIELVQVTESGSETTLRSASDLPF